MLMYQWRILLIVLQGYPSAISLPSTLGSAELAATPILANINNYNYNVQGIASPGSPADTVSVPTTDASPPVSVTC